MISVKKKPNTAKEVEKLLNPVVKKWFYSKFKEFSLPQLFGVTEIHSRNNILVSAPTGATKTLTAFMAILNELTDSAQKGILQDKIHCVYISPLKALNNDIHRNLIEPLKEIEEIAEKELGIRVMVRTGDTTAKEKAQMLKNPPHILITTPESLGILLSSIKFRENLRNVDWCIVDEIHALAENKRGVHLSLSLERLQRLSPAMCRIGLSATISPLDEVARFLAGNDRNCKIVDVQFIKKLDLKVMSPVPDLVETTHGVMHDEMYKLMHNLIKEHKTTLIFTNTRAATERVVHHLKEKFPNHYNEENIGAHHGSLSKELRHQIENNLREGKLKTVVCSTSLELGIDIGYIDLVILLGSPKSVARALQRIGRSGHRLHDTTKGRIIVLDRDDLVECSVLLKSAIEKKIDKIDIPTNALDVLAQQIFGIAIEEPIDLNELYKLVKKSYCYKNLEKKDFNEVIDYLAGKFASLEDRHVYAKIWHTENRIGKKGKMARVIYMTNIGTIPDETAVKVKVGNMTIGKIDEGFLERLRKRDIFVLGGATYEFRHSRGMTVQVERSSNKPPTVPSWFSEMLPLSFDLAMDIGKFRRLIAEKFKAGKTKKEIMKFINDYLYVDKNAANAIYEYFKEQFEYVNEVPSDKKLLIEHYIDENKNKYIVFHTMLGRRVNDALSRAVAWAVLRNQHRDVEIGVADNGFFLTYEKDVHARKAIRLLKSKQLRDVLKLALEKSEVLRRRFRHCATRALMILRNYKGRTKRVGRQQLSSTILMNAVRRISEDFCILKEARREVLEDLMDIKNATKVLAELENKKIEIKEIQTKIPTPFAFSLVLQGYIDILKVDDKVEFLRRMHRLVKAKIELEKGKKKK
jgi:ATP-dependent Lhr-like helicase